jgi:succinylglutamic semialdehyde dehydrogenase
MIEFKGAYINGRFVKSNGKTTRAVIDPGNREEIVGGWWPTGDQVDDAVEAAQKAFKKWAWLRKRERVPYMLALQEAFKSRKAALAELISREMGKPLRESTAEVNAAIKKIDITYRKGMKLVQRSRPNRDGSYYRYHPRGVLAIVGPFNFPLHLPNGQWAAALATGNTVIFKPSELTPFTGQLIAECFHEAGFPPGTFNLIQGDGKVGEALTQHPGIQGTIFVGSDGTGRKILKSTIDDPNKICVLEMGGKNAAIIMPDAPFQKALDACVSSALSTTGQRCNSLSRVIIHEDLVTSFMVEFTKRVLDWTPGYYKNKKAMMGPLVSAEALKKFLKYQDMADKEGAAKVLQGRAISNIPSGHYVTPGVHRLEWKENKGPQEGYRYDEIFGPDIAVYTFKTNEEAIQIHNDCRYGLAASIFTQKATIFEEMYHHIRQRFSGRSVEPTLLHLSGCGSAVKCTLHDMF